MRFLLPLVSSIQTCPSNKYPLSMYVDNIGSDGQGMLLEVLLMMLCVMLLDPGCITSMWTTQ